jgi:hypothetical protein
MAEFMHFSKLYIFNSACQIKQSQSIKIAEIPPFRNPFKGLNSTLEKKHFTGYSMNFFLFQFVVAFSFSIEYKSITFFLLTLWKRWRIVECD